MVCILDYNLLASASTGFAANLCSNSGFSLKWNVVNKISRNWLVLIQQQTCWLANGLSLFGVKPILNVNGDSLREPSQVAIIISVVCLWVVQRHRPRRRGASGAQSVKPASFNSEKRGRRHYRQQGQPADSGGAWNAFNMSRRLNHELWAWQQTALILLKPSLRNQNRTRSRDWRKPTHQEENCLTSASKPHEQNFPQINRTQP